MRIAVFGGTFDPVHYGHLRLAEEVREALSLDRVVFMPTFMTPHKPEGAMTPAGVRLELLRLAIAGNQCFEASDLEIRREGRSYTIDTVRELKKAGATDVSLIVGSDSFNDIGTWKEHVELLMTVSFIVVPRPGYPFRRPAEVLPVELASEFWYDNSAGAYVNSGGNSITYLETAPVDISSSGIRDRIAKGRSVRYLLPDVVVEFIHNKRLYR